MAKIIEGGVIEVQQGPNSFIAKFMFTCALILFTFLIGWTMGEISGMSKMEHQAFSRGYGLFCPGDGKFAWVGECDEN